VDSAILLSPTNPLRKQHINVATSPVGIRTGHHCDGRVPESREQTERCQAQPVRGDVREMEQPITVPELSSFMEKRVGVIVLDEVDEMVRNPGFFRQVVRIVEACKSARIFASRPPLSASAGICPGCQRPRPGPHQRRRRQSEQPYARAPRRTERR
jgi:hypothetical protein